MNARTFGWLVFVALIKNFTWASPSPFELEDGPLTAKEGSCVEIKCTVVYDVPDNGAYWFWMKDAQWIDAHKNFTATIIYSTDKLKRPVSPDFESRVEYVGSSSSSWSSANSLQPRCGISICNLRVNDSGQYSFRFIGPARLLWVTQRNVTLTVTENPCLVAFGMQPVVRERDTVTLTCSTLTSCSARPRIEPSWTWNATQRSNATHQSVSVSFAAQWQDDGREFACQTEGNADEHLKRRVGLTVEYAPRDVSIRISPDGIKEGDSVTLTCVAKGNPKPRVSFFRNNTSLVPESRTPSQWTITSITSNDDGEYYCEANNTYGNVKSKPVTINVKYAPDVEIETTGRSAAVRQGDTVTLKCGVKRSNPPPTQYSWSKDGRVVDARNTFVKQMARQDGGSYTCAASNAVGTGTSKPIRIQVEYLPDDTKIITSQPKETVKAESFLMFTCITDAHPGPLRYSWYRYHDNKQKDSSLWTSKTTKDQRLRLDRVQRADKACYSCNATNSVGTGSSSDEVCIQVLYPPTVPVLSMESEVTENQTMTISCAVDSFPLSTLNLTRTSSSSAGPPGPSFRSSRHGRQSFNKVQHTFNATSGDAGIYACTAENSEGSQKSSERKLVVRYTPRNVMIHRHTDVVENRVLSLYCTAEAYPRVDSFSWTKDGKEDRPISRTQNLTVKSASVSDSGLYRCAASNAVGTGHSQAAEVQVQYAPKLTKIITSREQQLPGGGSYVTLSCSTRCHPPVKLYLWYKEEKGIKRAQQVHAGQNYTVFSDQPGIYYCVAKNQINEKSSDPVHLFDGTWMKILKISLCVILPLIVVIVVFVCRYRKNSAVQRGATPARFGFLGWSSGARRGPALHGTFLAEPSRSRDDLLPDRSHRPEAQRCQTAPDSTRAADITSVYSMVSVPPRQQAPTAPKPTKSQQGGRAGAESTSGDKRDDKQSAENGIYAKVCKSAAHNKAGQEWLPDYENVGAKAAAHSPNALDDDDTDTDNSDNDVQLNYAQVSFTANPGRQRAGTDSSSSDDYEIQYSDVKI